MLGKKKEDPFFAMFREFAVAIEEMGGVFGRVIEEYEQSGAAVVRLKEMESECDGRAHQLLEKLNASFVTPFDREDIYDLTRQLDDVADYIEEAACMFSVYDVRSLRDEAVEMGKLLVEATEQIVLLFDSIGDKKKTDVIKGAIRRINHLENQGDDLHRQALSGLFREEKDAIELIRWKDIYEVLEDALDACEHLADTVKGVLTKNA